MGLAIVLIQSLNIFYHAMHTNIHPSDYSELKKSTRKKITDTTQRNSTEISETFPSLGVYDHFKGMEDSVHLVSLLRNPHDQLGTPWGIAVHDTSSLLPDLEKPAASWSQNSPGSAGFAHPGAMD